MRKRSRATWRHVLLGASCIAVVNAPVMAWSQQPPPDGTSPPPVEQPPPEPPPPVDAPPPGDVAPPPAVEPAPAAPTPAAGGVTKPEGKVEEVYITGSRLKRVDLNTPAPVSVLSRDDIASSGLQSIGDVLQRLPAQSNAIGVTTNNGGNGSTTVNLRGIGDVRTLVLLNGRRFVAGGSAGAAVDLNSIPTNMIERIEVLKDGASAIYGSDAIGGVVNIITRKNFSGVEGSSYLGGTRAGGTVYSLGVTGGQRAESGGFMLGFQYYNHDSILAGQRPFAARAYAFDFDCNDAIQKAGGVPKMGDPDPQMVRMKCDTPDGGTVPPGGTIKDPAVSTAGSSRIPEGRIGKSAPRGVDPLAGNANWKRLVGRYPTAGLFTNGPNKNAMGMDVSGFRPFMGTGNKDTNEGDLYNFQPENYLLTPSQRISLWSQGDHVISQRVSAYFEGSFNNRRSEQLLAPEPLIFGAGGEALSISANSIYNPFGRDFNTMSRRMTEAGNRVFTQDNNTYRAVVGLNGSYAETGWLSTWAWDVNFIYGRTDNTSTNRGSLVRHALADAVGPSFIDDQGVPRCGAPGRVIADCTPINMLGGAGSITQAMLRRLTYTGILRGLSDQRIFSASTEGELFSIWDRPVRLAVGYNWRREEGVNQPNPLVALGDSTGNKSEGTAGGYTENAVFAEINVPLLANLPAVDLLEFTGAARIFHYDTLGSDSTYKAGGRWQVMKHLALRGTYSTAFRAPSIGELFAGQADNFPNVNDPCIRATPGSAAARNCAADGVPPDLLGGGSSQLLTRIGGNPALQAETAKIHTIGVVITPKGDPILDNLSLTLDYWNFDIKDAIQPIGAQVILNGCYARAEGRSFCDKIQRDSSGFVDRIIDLNTNVGGTKTDGIDIGLLYRIPSTFGDFRLSFDSVRLGKFNAIIPDPMTALRTIRGRGNFDISQTGTGGGTGGVYPEWRFNTGLSWFFKGASLGTQLRYIGPIKECKNNNCADEVDPMTGAYVPVPQRQAGSNVNVDVFASYAFTSPWGSTILRAGINNLFDQDPVVLYNGFAANTDTYSYNLIGRFFHAGLVQKF